MQTRKESESELSLSEAAIELGFGGRTNSVLRLILERQIKARQVKRLGFAEPEWRVPVAEVDRWLRPRFVGDPSDVRRAHRRSYHDALKSEAHRATVEARAHFERTCGSRRRARRQPARPKPESLRMMKARASMEMTRARHEAAALGVKPRRRGRARLISRSEALALIKRKNGGRLPAALARPHR
jgi:hypothetical protein